MAESKNQNHNLSEIIQQVQGIGPALAGRIVEIFPTLEYLHEQTAPSLSAKIKGLSLARAKALKNLIAQLVNESSTRDVPKRALEELSKEESFELAPKPARKLEIRRVAKEDLVKVVECELDGLEFSDPAEVPATEPIEQFIEEDVEDQTQQVVSESTPVETVSTDLKQDEVIDERQDNIKEELDLAINTPTEPEVIILAQSKNAKRIKEDKKEPEDVPAVQEKPPIKWHSPLEVNYNSQSINIPVKNQKMFFESNAQEQLQANQRDEPKMEHVPKVSEVQTEPEKVLVESVLRPAEQIDTRQEIINNFATFRKAQVHLNYASENEKKIGPFPLSLALVGLGVLLLLGAGIAWLALPEAETPDKQINQGIESSSLDTAPGLIDLDSNTSDPDEQVTNQSPEEISQLPEEEEVLVSLDPDSGQADNDLEQPSEIGQIEPEQTEIDQTTEIVSPIAYEQISVQVLNGNGVRGVAGQLTNRLQEAGFVTQSTDNANRFNYPRTTVYFASGDQAKAEALQQFLESDLAIELAEELYPGQTA
ncbi:MAG TPA: LytR family transcriptional regulator, partial [Candidatus Wirthbacteria bacterium]|nr:LytR family transcriptional regulator [Candidatus Wirthbacteria bacterium]